MVSVNDCTLEQDLTAGMVGRRLDLVHQRIEAEGGDPAAIEVVAVTKGFGAGAVRAARAAGLQHLGENYADELVAKARVDPGACWHFLGALQRNKTSRLAPFVGVWEALDRAAAAEAVAARAPGATVAVQVNMTGEPTKHGCAPAEAEDLVARCRDLGLDVSGLMTVGPTGDREGTRACFRALATLGRALGLQGLSMGMSDDFDLAVGEGATTIRLGRALFGARPTGSPARR